MNSEYVSDFIYFAPFGNAGDSKENWGQKSSQFLDFAASVKLR